jgi:hypothetical protein
MWYPVITAGAEKGLFVCGSPSPFKEFVVQPISASSVMFEVPQASCVVDDDSFFKKSLQKEVRWHKVW